MEPEDILNIRLERSYECDAVTIKEYLIKLLSTLWREAERFSGKRPFGSSNWQYRVYKALIKYGVVPGELDEEDDIVEVDTKQADAIMEQAIRSLGKLPAEREHNG